MNNYVLIHPLKGAIQHYDWGGYDFIPDLLSIKNKDQIPHAEYWIGSHHRGPAQIKIGDRWTDIREMKKLPFLLKILDVGDMLSIQSHPNKTQAEIGFKNENEAKIPLDAKHRVFKDDNHKPELMVALSDFWLLHGFKSMKDIKALLREIPPFQKLDIEATDLKSLYSHIMRMENHESDKILQDLQSYLAHQDCTNKDETHYWANRAFEKYGLDKGIFSIYFFNLVKLLEGEAIYQEAGIPHAYLEGQNVEIMANSDNVFRAGLTPKHIDIDLLIDHLVFETIIPKIIHPKKYSSIEIVFISPATEFEVRQISLDSDEMTLLAPNNSECYFVLEGAVKTVGQSGVQEFEKGDSFFVNEAGKFELKGKTRCKIIRALTPIAQ